MQRVGLALGAPVGRLLGYGAEYVPTGRAPRSRAVRGMRRRLFWAALVVALLVLAAVGLFMPKDTGGTRDVVRFPLRQPVGRQPPG